MRLLQYALLLLLPAIILAGFTTLPAVAHDAPPQNEKVYHYFYGTTNCQKQSHFFVSQIVHVTPKELDEERKNFVRKVEMQFPQYTRAAGCKTISAKTSEAFYSSSDCARSLKSVLYNGRRSSGTAHEITW